MGDLRAARTTPRGAEIQQNDFPAGGCQIQRLPVERVQLELWRGIGVAHKPNSFLSLRRLGGRSPCSRENCSCAEPEADKQRQSRASRVAIEVHHASSF